jgi:hypothetical protein
VTIRLPTQKQIFSFAAFFHLPHTFSVTLLMLEAGKAEH